MVRNSALRPHDHCLILIKFWDSYSGALCKYICVYSKQFLSRIPLTPSNCKGLLSSKKKIHIDESKDRIAHRASGDKSPRVFTSQFSNPLTPLNALTDFTSSPNSDLESIVSYKFRRPLEAKDKKDKRNIHQSSGAIHF